jgi:hypothetical protein
MATKVIVIGDVNGRLSEVFGKVAALHAKNNFGFAIVAGNLFKDIAGSNDADQAEIQKLLDGQTDVPLTTYFALGHTALPTSVVERLIATGGELCSNLSILGRKVSFKTSQGIKIVAIGGKSTPAGDELMDDYTASYRDRDVESAADFKNADILVTSDWPKDITHGSAIAKDKVNAPPSAVESIGNLCSSLKPRYHFSTSESFFEREPFQHEGPAPRHITRFLSLAPFGNADKQKWIYAFALEPSVAPPDTAPMGTTPSPLTAKKRKLPDQQESFDHHRFSNGASASNDNYHHNRRGGNNKRRKLPPPLPQQCYFCLSNPNCETHMIASLGTDVYLATAKGPLSTAQTFAPHLDFPSNILIIPLNHAPTMAAIPEADNARAASLLEMQKYRDALHQMVAAKSRGEDQNGKAKLGAVTWEISRAGGVHLHWQFLPVTTDFIVRGLVEAGFEVEAENLDYPKFVKSASERARAMEGDYFHVMIWTEDMQREIVLPLDQSFRFDLQFGRRVMGKLLGLEERTNWRDCAQTKAEEDADANAFKAAFKQFDFSLDD